MDANEPVDFLHHDLKVMRDHDNGHGAFKMLQELIDALFCRGIYAGCRFIESRMVGLLTRALAMRTLWACPPESVPKELF